MGNICPHCKHYKTKYLHGVLVSEYCNKGARFCYCLRCNGFKRSLKSRLHLVTE